MLILVNSYLTNLIKSYPIEIRQTRGLGRKLTSKPLQPAAQTTPPSLPHFENRKWGRRTSFRPLEICGKSDPPSKSGFWILGEGREGVLFFESAGVRLNETLHYAAKKHAREIYNNVSLFAISGVLK
jgi:hypothetical protein